jgi:hypothetical protein
MRAPATVPVNAMAALRIAAAQHGDDQLVQREANGRLHGDAERAPNRQDSEVFDAHADAILENECAGRRDDDRVRPLSSHTQRARVHQPHRFLQCVDARAQANSAAGLHRQIDRILDRELPTGV